MLPTQNLNAFLIYVSPILLLNHKDYNVTVQEWS